MIAALIFLGHVFFAAYLLRRGRRVSTTDGWLGISLALLVFAVGWTISTMIVNLLWPVRGIGLLIDGWGDTPLKRLLYREVTSDTGSLVLLTIGEIIFYVWYLRSGSTQTPEEKAPTTGA